MNKPPKYYTPEQIEAWNANRRELLKKNSKAYYHRNKETLNALRAERYKYDEQFREAARVHQRMYKLNKAEKEGKLLGEGNIERGKHKEIREHEVEIKAGKEIVQTKMYLKGHLAMILGVKPETILKWEARGIIPKPTYFSEEGWRLYTPDQVRLLQIVYAEIPRKKKKWIRWSNFQHLIDKIQKEWNNMPYGFRKEGQPILEKRKYVEGSVYALPQKKEEEKEENTASSVVEISTEGEGVIEQINNVTIKVNLIEGPQLSLEKEKQDIDTVEVQPVLKKSLNERLEEGLVVKTASSEYISNAKKSCDFISVAIYAHFVEIFLGEVGILNNVVLCRKIK